MRPELLKINLDKVAEACGIRPDFRGETANQERIRKLIKSFTEEALEGTLKSIGSYGQNTHSYAEANAYLIEFRGKV